MAVNDDLKDAAVRHQVFLLSYTGGRVKEMGPFLLQLQKCSHQSRGVQTAGKRNQDQVLFF